MKGCDVYELPLFPLNTVLFPGTPIFLHIFEQRYKVMINRCIDQDRPFGIVFVGHSGKPHDVGCAAHILQVERLQEGRMNIVAMGLERFRLTKFHTEHPYLCGLAESYPLLTIEPTPHLRYLAQQISPWVEHYTNLLKQVAEVQVSWQKPKDPLDFGYMAAHLLQVPPAQKQAWLLLDSAAEFLLAVSRGYRFEISLLKAMIKQANCYPHYDPDNFYSLN